MKKIYILTFIFFILFTITCNSSAIDINNFDQTDINPSLSNTISYPFILNPFIIAITLIYFGISIIFIHLFQNTRNDKLVVRYKVLILVLTLLLHTFFKKSNGGLHYYSPPLLFALIEIFLGIFPKRNNVRIILTLIPCIILCVLFLPTITSSQCISEDPNHEMFHIMENIINFFLLVILPEIISQLALTPLYLYFKKNNN